MANVYFVCPDSQYSFTGGGKIVNCNAWTVQPVDPAGFWDTVDATSLHMMHEKAWHLVGTALVFVIVIAFVMKL